MNHSRDSVCRLSKQPISKLLDLINEFSNIVGYKFNKILIAFLG